MPPRAIIASGLDDACVRLYCLLDSYPTDYGPINGADRIAALLGWSARKVTEHLTHLRVHGLISVKREGQKRYAVTVTCNPSRWRDDEASLALPPSRMRYKKASQYANPCPASDAGVHPRRTRTKRGLRPASNAGRSDSMNMEGDSSPSTCWCGKRVEGHPFDDHEPSPIRPAIGYAEVAPAQTSPRARVRDSAMVSVDTAQLNEGVRPLEKNGPDSCGREAQSEGEVVEDACDACGPGGCSRCHRSAARRIPGYWGASLCPDCCREVGAYGGTFDKRKAWPAAARLDPLEAGERARRDDAAALPEVQEDPDRPRRADLASRSSREPPPSPRRVVTVGSEGPCGE